MAYGKLSKMLLLALLDGGGADVSFAETIDGGLHNVFVQEDLDS